MAIRYVIHRLRLLGNASVKAIKYAQPKMQMSTNGIADKAFRDALANYGNCYITSSGLSSLVSFEGMACHLQGSIVASGCVITSLKADIIGTTVSGSVSNVNTSSYNLYNSELDAKLKFSALKAGTYTVRILAYGTNGARTTEFQFPVTVNKQYNILGKGMTANELTLIKSNPVQAGIAYICSQKALNYTKEYYGVQGYQDNSDAFRHCLWNALMAKEMGVNYAKMFSNAHEGSNTAALDARMDIYNNNIGCNLPVSSKTESGIVNLVRQQIVDGHCRRFNYNGSSLIPTDRSGLKK